MGDTSSEITNPDLTYLYRALTVPDITSLVARSLPNHRPRERVGSTLKCDKRELLKSLLDDDPYWAEELYKIAIGKLEDQRRLNTERNRQKKKRNKAAKKLRKEKIIPTEAFMELPADSNRSRCYTETWKATLNANLEHRICTVCARLRSAIENNFSRMKVADIPNPHKLAPHIHVPSQTLFDACLLEPKGCHEEGSDWVADICKECLEELKGPKQTPPKHSLANNLWIGEIPWELASLTFAKQLLVARVFPRVFIMKLYPKDRLQRNLPRDQVQSGLRGNVTSFELNSPAIADMVAGQLMPQPISVLASTLSVTFIGREKIEDLNSLSMLRVRRDAIERALIWLQKNNRYYRDIKIDGTRLDALPDDAVPELVQAGVRHEANKAMAEDEHQGYAPDSYFTDNADEEAVPLTKNDAEGEDHGGPDIIPLQHLGVMDNDLSKVSTEEFIKWGLGNMEGKVNGSHQEPGYAIQYGAPVNTFGQPPQGQGPGDPGRRNFWEVAFPLLYPYGVGGIKSDRPVLLSLNDQGRWSLEYNDRRFRYHPSFMFTVFGILQRRQGLLSAKLQMRRHDFDAVARTLSTITPEDLRRAAAEEAKGERPSNPAIQVLKQHVTATSRRVMASGPSRTQLCSQIQSAAIYFNQPTIWLTINPDDLHDLIAQIFACEEINMDNFIRTAGPDSTRRSQNIARNPYAAAKFFNFAIMLMLEKLFGITVSKTRVHTEKGFLG
ncbi:hypothetical protein FRC12_016382 [Ceratobasidium sp. 428]|nr:hypothetical protein FRC12_016382 [Ceratobasidium sp. 428]